MNTHDYDVDISNRTLYLMPGEESLSSEHAARFVKNLHALQLKDSNKDIKIHQYSIGGDFSAAIVIYDAISTCKCPIQFYCHGVAASIGSLIPQACLNTKDTRITMPNTVWMIHDGEASYHGTHKQVQSISNLYQQQYAFMLDTYSIALYSSGNFNSLQSSKDFLIEHLDRKEDWYLSAAEAVYWGFADRLQQ